ncbi:hypothetical protein ACAX43_12425 [Paraburkholderia sp. IW21]|uniref:hypothetical protein n=1 Tax=Paraburkholderia sp. IW21 TaxID=3242488 RepID=UPI003522B63D
MQRNQKSVAEYDAQIAKGNEAAALLSNPLLTSTLDKLEAEATQKMIDSLVLSERELAWHRVQAMRALKAELQTLTNTGRLAKQKKDQLKGE